MPSKPDIIKNIINEPESVVFKGYKAGLTLIIPENGPFEKYLRDLKNNLDQSQDFFKDAKVFLKIGKRVLNDDEQSELVRLIEQYGLNFQGFQTGDESGNIKRKSLTVSVTENNSFVSTITVKKTVRSGQRVSFEGNLVIIGDVNPGAELAATGDIIVLGKLRGIAHAGAQGDISAQIIAFQLHPVQIRIAEVITRAPESESHSNHHGPEIARIKDGMIIVEKFNY